MLFFSICKFKCKVKSSLDNSNYVDELKGKTVISEF